MTGLLIPVTIIAQGLTTCIRRKERYDGVIVTLKQFGIVPLVIYDGSVSS